MTCGAGRVPSPALSITVSLWHTEQQMGGHSVGRVLGYGLGWLGKTRPKDPFSGPWGPRTLTHSRKRHSAAEACQPIPRILPSLASTSS